MGVGVERDGGEEEAVYKAGAVLEAKGVRVKLRVGALRGGTDIEGDVEGDKNAEKVGTKNAEIEEEEEKDGLADMVGKKDATAGGDGDTLVLKVPIPPTALIEGDEVPLPPTPPPPLPLGHQEAEAPPQVELVVDVLAALTVSGVGVRVDASTPREGEGREEGVGEGVCTRTVRVGWNTVVPREEGVVTRLCAMVMLKATVPWEVARVARGKENTAV